MKYWMISVVFAALSVVNVALNIKHEYMDDGVSSSIMWTCIIIMWINWIAYYVN